MDILDIRGDRESVVSRITPDSRMVVPGALFVAIRGHERDGHAFIDAACKAGAGVVVAETPCPSDWNESITWVQVAHGRNAMARMARQFYDDPSRHTRLVGVTGTNGKTSVVFTLYQLFSQLGYACGLLSTVRIRYPGYEEQARLTTPDVVSLNGTLRAMVDAGCELVFMEVSSHAADQGRIDGLHFAGGVFTNITHDHLDYHGTFANYLAAKKSFFDRLPADAFALVNADDRNGSVMVQNCPARKAAFALKHPADFKGRILENRLEGLLLKIGPHVVSCRMSGEFNASNLLAAFGAAMLLGEEEERVLSALSACLPPPGRLEVFRHASGLTGVVDFAHTPDALEKVLRTLSGLKRPASRLLVVLGCGGDRDKAKRPVMGRLAARLADLAVFTSDNPRSEDPDTIIREMLEGVEPEGKGKVQAITARDQAIQIAVRLARPGDVILVAGKGHENYQEVQGRRTPFDDKASLMAALENYTLPV